MTSTIKAAGYGKPGPAASKFGGELAGPLLATMAALEASLGGSREALISLDVAALVSRNREQLLLSRKLRPILDRARGEIGEIDVPSGTSEGSKELRHERRQIEQVQMAANRIIFAIRIQSALLVRLRTKLQVMANMLAGPGAFYGSRWANRFRGQP
ncbi:MAG TPA: hypothetical protein VMF10_03435 [Candidatus Aquilonibacter sp.]|nr:hypothetical protein [Candidatus Aquilonibacter sp.]